MDRGEDGLHLRKVGLNRFAQNKSVRRLKKNLGDQNIASGMLVDPFNSSVRIGRGPGPGPPERLQRLCQRVGHTGPVINHQYFH